MTKSHSETVCPRYHYAVELLGRRWTGAIVSTLLAEPRRFAELATIIPDLSDRMLAERLRELEEEGIVDRTVTPEIPVRVEYSLTQMGRALEPAIRALGKWAEDWLPRDTGKAPASDARLPAAKKAGRSSARR